MTLTIELTPEIESRLEAEAKRNGMSKTDLAKNVIEERFAPKEKRQNHIPEGVKPRYVGKAKTRDFSGDREWLAENRNEYIGQHVALHGKHLIANGESYKEVATKAREAGFKDALIVFVEDPNAPPFVEFIS